MLHIETNRGVPSQTATTLEAIAYRLLESIDPRSNTAHDSYGGTSNVDLVAGAVEDEIVDVLMADHPAPTVVERLRCRDMVAIEDGTQALRRTVNARLEITEGTATTISVPQPFSAVISKSAAYTADSRDQERDPFDAVALLVCAEDLFEEREGLTPSDRYRLLTLRRPRRRTNRHGGRCPPVLAPRRKPPCGS